MPRDNRHEANARQSVRIGGRKVMSRGGIVGARPGRTSTEEKADALVAFADAASGYAGRQSAEIIVIGAMAGIIIAILDRTGLGQALTLILAAVGEDSLFLLLVLRLVRLNHHVLQLLGRLLDLAGEEERASSQVLSRSQGAGLMQVLGGRGGVRRGARAPWHRTCRVNASRRSGGTSPAPWK